MDLRLSTSIKRIPPASLPPTTLPPAHNPHPNPSIPAPPSTAETLPELFGRVERVVTPVARIAELRRRADEPAPVCAAQQSAQIHRELHLPVRLAHQQRHHLIRCQPFVVILFHK